MSAHAVRKAAEQLAGGVKWELEMKRGEWLTIIRGYNDNFRFRITK